MCTFYNIGNRSWGGKTVASMHPLKVTRRWDECMHPLKVTRRWDECVVLESILIVTLMWQLQQIQLNSKYQWKSEQMSGGKPLHQHGRQTHYWLGSGVQGKTENDAYMDGLVFLDQSVMSGFGLKRWIAFSCLGMR